MNKVIISIGVLFFVSFVAFFIAQVDLDIEKRTNYFQMCIPKCYPYLVKRGAKTGCICNMGLKRLEWNKNE